MTVAEAESHPMLRGDAPEHPNPLTATRGKPVMDPTTPDGAAARIGSILRGNPELDPGRPEGYESNETPSSSSAAASVTSAISGSV